MGYKLIEEMAGLPWALLKFPGDKPDPAKTKRFDDILKLRLGPTQTVLASREWLVGAFSIADIAMADVPRRVDRFGGLAEYAACADYVARATSRPAFVKAHADQMAHFAGSD